MSDTNQKRLFFFRMDLFLKRMLGKNIEIDKMESQAFLSGKIDIESIDDPSKIERIEFRIMFNGLGALWLGVGTNSEVDFHDKVRALNLLNRALRNYKFEGKKLLGADAFYVVRRDDQEFPVMEWAKGENKWSYLRDLCDRAYSEDTFIEDVMLLNGRPGLEPIVTVPLVKKEEL